MDKRQEYVTVIGPVDPAPGKKMIYKPRKMKRGLAESPAVRRLGIQIVPDGVTEVITGARPQVTMNGTDVSAERIAELERQLADLQAAQHKAKPGRKPKTNTDSNAH